MIQRTQFIWDFMILIPHITTWILVYSKNNDFWNPVHLFNWTGSNVVDIEKYLYYFVLHLCIIFNCPPLVCYRLEPDFNPIKIYYLLFFLLSLRNRIIKKLAFFHFSSLLLLTPLPPSPSEFLHIFYSISSISVLPI